MDKYNYDTDHDEKLTSVKTYRVYLEEDLLAEDSLFREQHPTTWTAISQQENLQLLNFYFDLCSLKPFILSSTELFLIEVETTSILPTGKTKTRRQNYLSNRLRFEDITLLVAFTKLDGCQTSLLDSPMQDFVARFIGEKYF